MRKAKKEDVLDLLDVFCEKYDVNLSEIEPLIFKGLLNLPVYSELVDSSLVKTKKIDQPITLMLEKKNDSQRTLLMNVDYRKKYPITFEPDSFYASSQLNVKRIAKDSDRDLLNLTIKILEDSANFKDLINNLSANITQEQMESLHAQNESNLFSIMLDVYKAKKETDLEELQRQEHNIVFQFRTFERDNHLDLIPMDKINYNINFEQFKNNFSSLVSNNFDMFKYHNELVLGVAAVSETEQTIVNSPIVNDFFDKLAQDYPEYFLSRSDSLYEHTLDDNELKKHQTSALEYYKDFNLFNTEHFSDISAENALGFDVIPYNYDNEETKKNNVKFIGENPFFKEYFVNVEQKKSLNGLNFYEVTSFAFNKNLSVDVVKGVLKKCIQLSEKSGLVLDLKMNATYIDTKEVSSFNVVSYLNEVIHNYPKAKIINSRDPNDKISQPSYAILYSKDNIETKMLSEIKKNQSGNSNKIKQKI